MDKVNGEVDLHEVTEPALAVAKYSRVAPSPTANTYQNISIPTALCPEMTWVWLFWTAVSPSKVYAI